MVQTALTKGMVILHQFIPHWSIEKEIFVRLTPCRNCFAYEYKIKDCPSEQKMRCTFCGEGHKQTDCRATTPKCINCGGAHRTLAAACKIRKEIIKKRSKEKRDRSKSRTRQEGTQGFAEAQSYAVMAGTGGGGARKEPETTTPLTKKETKDMLTVIMSAIVYGHYMEALVPGSFQDNVNEIYKLNGLKNVKFPPPTTTATVMEACREVFSDRTKKDTRKEKDKDESGTQASHEADPDMELDDEVIEREEKEIDTMIKRHRELLTPLAKEDKRKKQGREMETKEKPPLPRRQPVVKPETGAVPKTKEVARERARGGDD